MSLELNEVDQAIVESIPAVHSSQLSSQRTLLGSTRNLCLQFWLPQRAGTPRSTKSFPLYVWSSKLKTISDGLVWKGNER